MTTEASTSIRKEYSVISPERKPRDNFYVDPSFANELCLHILKNAVRKMNPPLMLAIQGPKGEGKTQQVREVCSRIGVTILQISGSVISGGEEKEPLRIIRDAYVDAGNLWITRKNPVVILIDDIDTSTIAVQSDRRYGVNTQLVSGTLMHIADDPNNVGDRSTMRIPIILTGNNFQTLYGPLIRRGRMRFFDWVPSIDTKIHVVKTIFADLIPPQELSHIPEMVNRYAHEPVAFYAELKNDLVDDLIVQSLNSAPEFDFRSMLMQLESATIRTNFKRLMELAEAKQGKIALNFNADDRTVQMPQEIY